MKRFLPPAIALLLGLPALTSGACSSSSSGSSGFGAGGLASTSTSTSSANGGARTTSTGNPTSNGGSIVINDGGLGDSGQCPIHCSPDHHQVLDCNGMVQADCGDAGTMACDLTTGACSAPCTAAANNKQSVGCEFYATDMDSNFSNACYAVYIANNWDAPVHLKTVEFHANTPLDPTTFAVIPSGTGANITYTPYTSAGIPPGEVAIVFLSGASGAVSGSVPVPCPIAKSAIPDGAVVQGTAVGFSFHIETDLPVVAYQINPYGGGSAAVTGASLLLPTSVWDTNYVAVTAGTNPQGTSGFGNPSINIISQKDGTQVTLLPNVAIAGGGALTAGPANKPYTFTLNQGQQAQFSQQDDLTGTIIQATNPIGVMAGNACMQKPIGTDYCDHGEQMLPPVKSLGSEYVAVMWRPRVTGDASIWRIVGALDGTTLSYEPSPPAGAPTTISAGQLVEFTTADPFIVKAQDTSHPFMLFAQMPGAEWAPLQTKGYGDPDFVLGVAPSQFLDNYVFMTDPTYPETNLVVVRAPNATGQFQDVTLDCARKLTGWQNIGSYQWTRIDLMSHDFQGQNGCSTGPHAMSSTGLFGLWVWGWGSPETQSGNCNSADPGFSCYVSYGYPGGMNVSPVNNVVIQTQ